MIQKMYFWDSLELLKLDFHTKSLELIFILSKVDRGIQRIKYRGITDTLSKNQN